ncbi:MAG: family 43 glycosylhydrolase [Barnesiella sp.]|nr:family 43 glycosylhydrolase [Barnesiella sp.]
MKRIPATKAVILLMASAGAALAANAGQPLKYPMTREMHNPLFVEFPSPMYGSDSIGRLFTADPSGHVWADGRFYIYASHDMEPAYGCDRMDRYHVFSTDDMVNWTDHGEILSSADVKNQSGWGIEGWMWAPDCAYNPANGKYYFYFPHVNEPLPWGGHDWRTGVAVSDDPAGDFHMAGYIEGAPQLFDPCVFVDDDGQPYFYNGGCGWCAGGKLRRDDWTKLDGEMQRMEGLVEFHEGPWIHKYNGKYYLSHSDDHGADGNQLRYAMSDSPLGPWEDKGVYLYATGCGTSHGSIVEYKGKWYALYHCNNPSGKDELRSVCIDELEYNPDGTIRPIHNWGTPAGEMLMLPAAGESLTVNAVNYNNGGTNYAYYKNGGDAPEKASSTSGDYITNIHKGDWMRYSVNARNEGKYDITFKAKAQEPGTAFHLSVNGTKVSGDVVIDTPADRFAEITVEGVTINPDVEYIDLRGDNGTLDMLAIVITPSKQ